MEEAANTKRVDPNQNHYAMLGFPDDGKREKIPQDDIKKAYRKFAKKYHPDLHDGAAFEKDEINRLTNELRKDGISKEEAEKFQQELNKVTEKVDATVLEFKKVNYAYEVLGDEENRKAYHSNLAYKSGTGGTASGRFDWRTGDASFEQPGDIRTLQQQLKAQAPISKEATRTAFGLGGIISTFLGLTTGKAAMDAAKQEKAATTDEEKRKSTFLKFSSITATVFFGILSLYAFANTATTGGLHERLRNMFKNKHSI